LTQAEIDRHIETSERFLRHAEDQFGLGDLPQASEKAWGAVAHYLKSIAKLREWSNSSHSDLDEIAEDLAHETDNLARIRNLYRSISTLHRNFYEDRLPDGMVGGGIDDASELISRLGNRTKPPLETRPSQTRRRLRPY
jgi:HEPN domain-containing protein